MAAHKEKSKKINLLPQEEFASSVVGRILAWAVSTFRVIVIVTEVVVVGAFLSRFWLDAQSSDLSDQIKQKQAVVAATSDFEKTFREKQGQIKIFSDLTKNYQPESGVLNTVSSYLPSNIYLSNYSLVGKEIRIKGVSPTEQSIAQFIANLSSNKDFSDVSLSQLSTGKDQQAGQLVFTVKIILNNK
jgi:Tfp pilus assembly protein PilN